MTSIEAPALKRAIQPSEFDIGTPVEWLVEGVHGLAKTLHGMARAARRGLENMKIQALLTATAINLKRLAKAILLALIRALISESDSKLSV